MMARSAATPAPCEPSESLEFLCTEQLFFELNPLGDVVQRPVQLEHRA